MSIRGRHIQKVDAPLYTYIFILTTVSTIMIVSAMKSGNDITLFFFPYKGTVSCFMMCM